MTGQPTFPTLLEGFFTQRLMQQRQASAHTIASYRDTFRMLLQFAQKRLGRAPSTLALEDPLWLISSTNWRRFGK
jgi:site-specific recombinase XerC